MAHGTLYLIPVPLGAIPAATCLSASAIARIGVLRHFIAESAKSSRAFLKPLLPVPLASVRIDELPQQIDAATLSDLLAALRAGHDAGLLSEAGMPCVADPGAALVRRCHESGVRVVPLIGPSAVLLALAASGLNGQRFAFHGYLPVKEAPLRERIHALERDASARDETQIFIEAPYRNERLLDTLIRVCEPGTQIAVAIDLTLDTEEIVSLELAQWRVRARPTIDRRPAVFLLARERRSASPQLVQR